MERPKPKYLFKCENGKTYAVCKDMCIVCSKCSDIFYDYSNGPYLFFCEDNIDTEDNYCSNFEFVGESDSVEIYKGE